MTPSSWRFPFPRSLAGQLIGLLLIALFAAQAIGIWIFHDERRIALIEVARDNILLRAVSIAKLIDDTPETLQTRILEASSSRHTTFWIGDAPVVRAPGTDRTEVHLQQILADRFSPPRDVLLDLMDPRSRQPDFGNLREDDEDKDGERPQRPSLRSPSDRVHSGRLHRLKRGHIDLALSIPLSDGSFLNVETNYRPPPRTLMPLLVQLGLMALAVILIVAFAVRRVSRPLRDLANAAERLGRGEDVAELKATGPLEVRTVTEAFNSMQDRLTRFVRDRTRMLAAISHDLRTPITSLRLRAEFIEDDENRDKIIETLEEMSQMTEATLAFARDEAAKEEAKPTDLASLLESLAGDQQDLGHKATVNEVDRLVITCRPVALKRAFRNLIENGIRYGNSVEIDLARDRKEAVVTISDQGPGIPEDRLAEVFEPFVRLEESRSEETGGIGLGLAITRSIIHAHGGTIELKNGDDRGLKAVVRLPIGG
ncbi:ATP-binding protein [uncultured Roseibium sp.]|uniref:ATP-binding protein n=1 Tax=uncultured Roseibium sp. TaxID=1936171 RepID=UPI0032180DB7